MEKGPEIRIIGGASPEAKEQVREKIEQAFSNHFESLTLPEQRQLEKLEYPKSEQQLALIGFANQETSSLMEEAGIKPYDVPAENYHIIPPCLYKEISGRVNDNSTATAFLTKQGIVANAEHIRDNLVLFGTSAIHELLHLKAHLSMEVQEENGKVDTAYREGVFVRSLQSDGYHGKYHEHFVGLDEGIVTETEKKLYIKLLDHPELAKEKEWLMTNEAQKLKKEFAEKKEIPEDDIIWINKPEEKKDTISVSATGKAIPYSKQRAVLNYVCSEIQKQFPDKYQNEEDVYKIFLKANFTGQLLSIAKLVEKTFGKVSFRMLGNMNTTDQSGVLHLELLKKARINHLKLLKRECEANESTLKKTHFLKNSSKTNIN